MKLIRAKGRGLVIMLLFCALAGGCLVTGALSSHPAWGDDPVPSPEPIPTVTVTVAGPTVTTTATATVTASVTASVTATATTTATVTATPSTATVTATAPTPAPVISYVFTSGPGTLPSAPPIIGGPEVSGINRSELDARADLPAATPSIAPMVCATPPLPGIACIPAVPPTCPAGWSCQSPNAVAMIGGDVDVMSRVFGLLALLAVIAVLIGMWLRKRNRKRKNTPKPKTSTAAGTGTPTTGDETAVLPAVSETVDETTKEK